MKLEVSCTKTCVFIVSQCPRKPFHTVKWIAEIRKSKFKKRRKQGMSHSGVHVHKSREIFTSHVDKNKVCKELNAPTVFWSHWFHEGKAFALKTDTRSYAQVVAVSNNNTCIKSTNSKKLYQFPTRLVGTTLVENTPVKKNDKIAQNDSHKPAVLVSVTKPLRNIGKPRPESVPLNNRFQILENLQTNSTESLVDKVSTQAAASSVPNRGLDTKHFSTGCEKEIVASENNIKTSAPSFAEKPSIIKYHDSTKLDNECEVSSDQMKNSSLCKLDLNSHYEDAGFESCFVNTAIPMSIWSQKSQCKDFVQCVAQNGSDFGALPITDQLIYPGPPTCNSSVTNIFDLHTQVRDSKKPNFWGCRVPL